MKKAFEVGKVPDSGNFKGLVLDWALPDSQSIVIYFRKKGTEFGGHFHKGVDPSKNPERLLVVAGKMRLRLYAEEGISEIILGQGDFIVIEPNVCHYAYALEDVIFLERRIQPFNPSEPDTYLC